MLHNDLVSECIWYLEKKGFSNFRRETYLGIVEELNKAVKVDIMAKSPIDNIDIPIECGNIGLDFKTRVRVLADKFEYCYWYPISGLLIKLIPEKLGSYGIPEINSRKLKCLRCGHRWNPRVDKPEYCPICHSPCWNKEKEMR